MIRFTAPLALLFLLLLPVFAWVGWPASRGPARRREIISLILRLLLALCLVLTVAGVEVTDAARSDHLSVVFLLDVSDSMPLAAQQMAQDYIRQALEKMGPQDQAGLVVFGGEALVERPLSSSRQLQTITSIPDTNHTDLAEAIQLALALFPSDTARRLVILSDGAVTTGDPIRAARLAAASGVQVVALPFVVDPGAEALVTAVDAPQRLRQGDAFNMEVTVQSSASGPAELRVLAAGELVYTGQVELNQGIQTFSLPLQAKETGFIAYQVQLVPAADHFFQNNTQATYSMVSGPPKVLLVAPPAGEPLGVGGELRPDEAAALRAALEAGGFIVETVPPSRLPSDLSSLVEYASVALVDVPARQLSQRQMLALTSYVRDLGGGLVTVGGPTSYGVGGYFRTPLEEALPIEMAIKDEQRRAALAIVFIIDHSGSMSDTSGGTVKLELAKEAAIRSVELLLNTDRVGVIVFDDSASWVVPMTELTDPSRVTYAISTVRPGGGTDILAGVQAMAAVLPNDPAMVKHVILLTDGGADPTGIPELVRRLYEENGITFTTVGVGRDAAPFLPELARIGGGRYHFAADPASIPSIFTEETTLATRAYLVEEPFIPQVASASPILNGIQSLPTLYGYVGTSAKTRAQTILLTQKGDPLLAAWQYGLGQVVSFTSDASGRWAKDWLAWEGFPTFWIQAVEYSLGDPLPSSLETRVEPDAADSSQAEVKVTALNPYADSQASSPFLNGYALQANIVAPDGNVQAITLTQTAPGQYTASFAPDAVGAYLLRLTGQPPAGASGEPAVAETAGWVQSYSAEYRTPSDPDLLYRLVSAAGGRIALSDPATIFTHDLPAPDTSRPAWPFLLALAACLLPLDIAVRRLVLERSDFVRAWNTLLRRFQPAPPVPDAQDLARRKRTEALLQIKQRPAEDQQMRPLPPVSQPAAPASHPPAEEIRVPPVTPSPGAEAQGPQAPTLPAENQSTAAALLAHKRQRRGK